MIYTYRKCKAQPGDWAVCPWRLCASGVRAGFPQNTRAAVRSDAALPSASIRAFQNYCVRSKTRDVIPTGAARSVAEWRNLVFTAKTKGGSTSALRASARHDATCCGHTITENALGPVNTIRTAATGAHCFECKEQGATNTERIRATRDEAIGTMRPVPKG